MAEPTGHVQYPGQVMTPPNSDYQDAEKAAPTVQNAPVECEDKKTEQQQQTDGKKEASDPKEHLEHKREKSEQLGDAQYPKKKLKVSIDTQRDSLSSPTVAVTTGQGAGERTFFIHRERLAADSGWFRTCMKDAHGSVLEAVRLNLHPDLFAIYADWLYFGHNALSPLKAPNSFTCTPVILGHTMHWLWVLGQQMDAECFQNAVVEKMHSTYYFQGSPQFQKPRLQLNPALFKDVNLSSSPQLYRLYLDIVVNHGGGCIAYLAGQPSNWINTNKAVLEPQVLADLACELERCRSWQASIKQCQGLMVCCQRYHRHVHTARCRPPVPAPSAVASQASAS